MAGNSSLGTFLALTPNSASIWANISCAARSLWTFSTNLVLLPVAIGSWANAFILKSLSCIPFTTISTNFGTIGTGFQSKFK